MARKSVALVIHNGVQALDVAGPLDVFAEANAFLDPNDGYDCTLVATDISVVKASNGMRMAAHLSFDEAIGPFHTVLVAGSPTLPDLPSDAAISSWLQAASAKAVRYGSICTGAFLLGHAGLLDGRIVTTHWQHAARLASMFPAARVEHDRIYARDERLVTSAGVTAGIDLALFLVAQDHGGAVSLSCAKRLVVVTQRHGGQSQFSALLLPYADPSSPLGKVQKYVSEHLAEAFPVERLAEIAGLSVRSLGRIFAKSLGITPHDYIENIRLDQARNLLEASDLALKIIAFDCGFASPEHMRGAFHRRLGLSPFRYRQSFRVSSSAVDRTSGSPIAPPHRTARRRSAVAG